MPGRKRNVHLHVMVTEDELAAIHARMAEAGISNTGAYVRKMALNGYILHVDLGFFHTETTEGIRVPVSCLPAFSVWFANNDYLSDRYVEWRRVCLVSLPCKLTGTSKN